LPKTENRKLKTLLYGLMALLTLGGMELGLRLFNHLVPNAILGAIDPARPDDLLGYRGNPKNPDHDRLGFRNAQAPDRIDVVALGDSQTYGTGVAREEAWPQQLQAMSGLKVYNMAFGGYSPAHSWLLLDEALALKPRLVIEAMYAGNDLYEAFNLTYRGEARLAPFKSADAAVGRAIAALEQQGTIEQQAKKADVNLTRDAKARTWRQEAQSWLYDNIKLYRLLSFTRQYALHLAAASKPPDFARLQRLAQEKYPGLALPLDRPPWRTILTPAYRLTVLNLEDARVAEGLHLSLGCLAAMAEKCAAQEVDFLVLLIPTKEMVFSEVAAPQDNPDYARLVANEARMWSEVKDFLESRRIPVVDGRPALQNQLHIGPQPYGQDDDGHPTAAGQKALAWAVQQYLASQKTAIIIK
jgi:hypothetical protein